MKKYRIKIDEKRIVGPLTKEQLGELYSKGRILGKEECQYFPAGEWAPLQDFKELAKMFLAIIDKKITSNELEQKRSSQTVINLSLDNIKEKREEPGVKEFQFSKKKVSTVSKPSKIKDLVSEEQEKEVFDSTVINVDAKAMLEKEVQDKKEAEEKKKRELEDVQKEAEEEERNRVKSDEKTEFINLAQIEAKDEVDEIERKILEHDQLSEFEKETTTTDLKNDEQDEDNGSQKSKRKLVYGLVALGMAAMFLMPDDSNKKKGPAYAKIKFPVAIEYENNSKSIELFRKGQEAYKNNSYRGRLKAARLFRKSLQNKFSGNKAIGNLILVYSELLNDSKSISDSSKVIFNLIKLARVKALSDMNIAMGITVFYSKLGKYKTAQNSFENYLRVSGKLTSKFFAYYLNILTKSDDREKAEKTYSKLCKGDQLPIEGFLYCAQYLKKEGKYKEALNFVTVGLEKHSKSVSLLLEKGMIAFEFEKYDLIKGLLVEIKKSGAEGSPVYYSKYLELVGIVKALSGDTEKAILFFQKALKIYDSEELRSKLASIESNDSDALVKESKSYFLMSNAKRELKVKNFDEALRLAVEAVDIAESNKDAKLLLAQIQTRMGYVSDAIKILIELQKSNATDTKVNYALINAYLEAERLDDAIKQILTVKNSNFNQTSEYASLLARYYSKKKNYSLAMNWFHKSITRDPLNDHDYYRLAKLHLRVKRYKESRLKLYKAMELEPGNIDYIALNGRLIYEVDGVDTAIGYIRKKLEKFPDNAKLMGDIAKYYYRSGMHKEFEIYKNKIEARVDVDEDYYRFMIDAAELEDRREDVIKYSEKLIALLPGDVHSRMYLGEYYIKSKKIDQALKILTEIGEQLATFPRLHYLMAKCYQSKRDYKKMIEEGEIEVKNNPNLEYGFYIAGEGLKLTKRYPEAVKMLEKAISINGQSVETLISLGWIKHKQNYLQEARELYMRALREDPGNPLANRELGYVYKSIGQSSLAIESLKLYLDIVPRAKDRKQIEATIKSLQ